MSFSALALLRRTNMKRTNILVCLLIVIHHGQAFHSVPLVERKIHQRSSSNVVAVGMVAEKSRRELFTEASSIALASLLTGRPSQAQALETQTILITGANSGIGFEACKRLASQGHTIVLACRTMEKATEAVKKLKGYGGSLIAAECDLASMDSIKAFADMVPSLTSFNKLDVLCLNAGIARNTEAKDVARTADGFELTVGTNHFGHFYLNSLLLRQMNANGGRIVVTASGVHDPSSPGGAQGVPATLGNLDGLRNLGKECEMIDGGAFNADKAYKDSKLCNVLFTRELQRRLDASSKAITANCFNPGLIVSTGLFRDQNQVFTKLFDFAATDLFKVGETPEWGGGSLAYMTTVGTKGMYYSSPPGSSKYGDAAFGREFTVDNVSKEASDDNKAKQLWELTEQTLGLASS